MAMILTEQIREAEAELSLAKATENKHKAAEASYVVARLYRDLGNVELAKQYARESFVLFEQLSINTLEDATPQYFSLAGIQLPNLIHEAVVRSTFPEYHL
jgi:hypothetical protein